MTKAQLLEYCIKEVGVTKEKALLVGDSEYDAKGAQETGIDFLGITYGFGFRSKKDADKYKSIEICNSAKDLLAFIISK